MVVEVVGVPEKPVGVALKALCSSGNLRLAKEGCCEAEKALGAGTELKAPPPPPVKVEVWEGKKEEEGGAEKELGVAWSCWLKAGPCLWCTFLSKGKGEGLGSLKNVLSVAEVAKFELTGGCGEDIPKPLPLRKTNT